MCEAEHSGRDLNAIRRAEAASHREAYQNHDLYQPGSWLAKPVKTVLELLPGFEGIGTFRALDLGCGVGRNSIAVARFFPRIPCRVECVDILELAIEKLLENAEQFGVGDRIVGVVSPIDEYEIEPDSYDLILGISALEHMDSKTAFFRKLRQIRDGIRPGGMACLIVNTDVREWDKASGRVLPPQFEVVLETDEFQGAMAEVFGGWQRVKQTVVHQKYDIPREGGIARLETDVVTWVVKRRG